MMHSKSPLKVCKRFAHINLEKPNLSGTKTVLILLSWPRSDMLLLEEAKLFGLQEAEFGCGQARSLLTILHGSMQCTLWFSWQAFRKKVGFEIQFLSDVDESTHDPMVSCLPWAFVENVRVYWTERIRSCGLYGECIGADPCYRSITRSVARSILQDTEFHFSMYRFRCEKHGMRNMRCKAVGPRAPVLWEHHKKRQQSSVWCAHAATVPGPAIWPRATLGCRCCASGKTVARFAVQQAERCEIVSSAHRPLLVRVISR